MDVISVYKWMDVWPNGIAGTY